MSAPSNQVLACKAVIRHPCATFAPGPWLASAEDPVHCLSLTTAFLVGLKCSLHARVLYHIYRRPLVLHTLPHWA